MVQFSHADYRTCTISIFWVRKAWLKPEKWDRVRHFFFNWLGFKPSEFDKSWVEISEMIDASNLSYKGNKRCAKMGLPSAVLKRNKFGKKCCLLACLTDALLIRNKQMFHSCTNEVQVLERPPWKVVGLHKKWLFEELEAGHKRAFVV